MYIFKLQIYLAYSLQVYSWHKTWITKSDSKSLESLQNSFAISVMEVYIESMSLLISNDHVNFKVAFDAS